MMSEIQTPDSNELDALCRTLAEGAAEVDLSGNWPARQLELCGQHGVFRWFLPEPWGGWNWNPADVVRGYLALSAACLTTAFIITQRTGACRRIAAGENDDLKDRLLPDLTSGATFSTVGISHLTTSRRHLARPVLRAEATGAGFVLDGYSPWVTGGAHAQTVVVGATLEDDRQILVAAPTDLKGIHAAEPEQLVALSASHTGKLEFDRVLVERRWLVDGPVADVMQRGAGARTGGLETSTLAVGLATAAIEFLCDEANRREDLSAASNHLQAELDQLQADLLQVAAGEMVCTNEQLRTRANSLALRASQAALSAAKGAGFVAGHPAGRWCREALFFLVWSCPQPVLQANLCELAGLG